MQKFSFSWFPANLFLFLVCMFTIYRKKSYFVINFTKCCFFELKENSQSIFFLLIVFKIFTATLFHKICIVKILFHDNTNVKKYISYHMKKFLGSVWL
jgi:hypothetical protein